MRLSFLYNEVLTGLRRNITMTIAMILTTAISLATLGGGMIAVQMTHKTRDYFLQRVEVRFYLNDDISSSDQDCTQVVCRSLRDDLQNTPGVVSVQFLNQNDALTEAKNDFADQPEMVKLISANKLPASLRVKMSNPDDYGTIYNQFKDRPGVANVRNDEDIVNRLVSVFNGMRNAAFGLAVLQSIAALLLIANMVQIAAFTRRTEVSIMRLVGATRWYTQLPFVVEAVVAALAGALLAVVGLFVAKPLVLDKALGSLPTDKVLPVISVPDMLMISFYMIPIGVVFAALTAYATLRFYVRDDTN